LKFRATIPKVYVIYLDSAGMPWGWGDASANQLGWGPMTMPTRAPAFIPFFVPTV